MSAKRNERFETIERQTIEQQNGRRPMPAGGASMPMAAAAIPALSEIAAGMEPGPERRSG